MTTVYNIRATILLCELKSIDNFVKEVHMVHKGEE